LRISVIWAQEPGRRNANVLKRPGRSSAKIFHPSTTPCIRCYWPRRRAHIKSWDLFLRRPATPTHEWSCVTHPGLHMLSRSTPPARAPTNNPSASSHPQLARLLVDACGVPHTPRRPGAAASGSAAAARARGVPSGGWWERDRPPPRAAAMGGHACHSCRIATGR
jgi:hypothetical protein